MPDVGDVATATLTVAPFDGTTSASLLVTAPDATTSAPSASTADSGATWTAVVTYGQAGWWLLTWTVTGTGAGVEHQKVLVSATPSVPPYGPAYTTLELVKESLVAGGDTAASRDMLLLDKIASASRSIDDHCGRRFYLDAAASARILDPAGRTVRTRDGYRLLVDDIGSATGVTVEVGSATAGWTAVTSTVELEATDAAARGWAFTSLSRATDWLGAPRVKITARWGWPAVPQTIREAALIQTLRLYKRKDSPEGVLGSSEWGAVRVSRLDPDMAKLVERYVLDGFG
jgi:hypothetical protein